MYCEEIDWAWRIHRAGWDVYCVPSAHVTHLGGQSSSQVRVQSLIYLWQSRLMLFDRYFAPLKRFIARKMVAYGMQAKIRKLGSLSNLKESDRAALADAYQSIHEMASE
jgi:N-acetylglucosaminyl-diphospho-decaprenol L-rhamnosyltransferase